VSIALSAESMTPSVSDEDGLPGMFIMRTSRSNSRIGSLGKVAYRLWQHRSRLAGSEALTWLLLVASMVAVHVMLVEMIVDESYRLPLVTDQELQHNGVFADWMPSEPHQHTGVSPPEGYLEFAVKMHGDNRDGTRRLRRFLSSLDDARHSRVRRSAARRHWGCARALLELGVVLMPLFERPTRPRIARVRAPACKCT
jgi:hypothetical protein